VRTSGLPTTVPSAISATRQQKANPHVELHLPGSGKVAVQSVECSIGAASDRVDLEDQVTAIVVVEAESAHAVRNSIWPASICPSRVARRIDFGSFPRFAPIRSGSLLQLSLDGKPKISR
jgi:hypothetical protein